MELALQPSLLASLCWRQKDGGSAMMAERVGGRGRSKSSLLLQKPQLSLKAPSCVLGAQLWPTCSHCLSKGGQAVLQAPTQSCQSTAHSRPRPSQVTVRAPWEVEGLARGSDRGRQWQGGGQNPGLQSLSWGFSWWHGLDGRGWGKGVLRRLPQECSWQGWSQRQHMPKWGHTGLGIWGLTNNFHSQSGLRKQNNHFLKVALALVWTSRA